MATEEEIAAFNKAMQAQYAPALSALVRTRDPNVISSGSALSGIISPSDYAKRQQQRLKDIEKAKKDEKELQADRLAAARAAAGLQADREARQWEQTKRKWEISDRDLQLRLAEQQRQREEAARVRQGEAYRGIADLYRTQGEEGYRTALENIAAAYGGEEAALGATRERQLAALTKALGESRGQITSAEQQALQALVAPTAYQNVPLVDLSPQQQVLQAALAAEGVGASPEQVAEQNYAQQLAAQFNELARRSSEQLNVGEQNYLAALRNALTGGALAARTGLEQRGGAITGGIEEQYGAAMREVARQRAAEQAAAEQARQEALFKAAQAAAEAEAFSPAPKEEQPPTDVEAEAEAARRKAAEQLLAAILRGEAVQML